MIYLLRLFFFFNDTATTEIYTLSLHDALPISGRRAGEAGGGGRPAGGPRSRPPNRDPEARRPGLAARGRPGGGHATYARLAEGGVAHAGEASFSSYQAIVRARPSSRSTRASQPRSSFALLTLGMRISTST